MPRLGRLHHRYPYPTTFPTASPSPTSSLPSSSASGSTATGAAPRLSAATLATYYILIVILVMHGLRAARPLQGIRKFTKGLAQQFAITAASLIVYAATARIPASTLGPPHAPSARSIFGLCALVWGGAHFVYMNLTAPTRSEMAAPLAGLLGISHRRRLSPRGPRHLSRVQARRAAILFTACSPPSPFLVHIRILFTNHKTEVQLDRTRRPSRRCSAPPGS